MGSFKELVQCGILHYHAAMLITLVDEHDQPQGPMEKLQAHQEGRLHLAFSIFLLRKRKGQWETLLQQRHADKYHSGGLWTNSCCSHPGWGEYLTQAAKRRLYEELGIETPLKAVGYFIYRAELGNGLIEHELDHVLVGEWEGDECFPHPEEIAAIQWMGISELQGALKEKPGKFTVWLPGALELVVSHALRGMAPP